jgi:hypothetical protein
MKPPQASEIPELDERYIRKGETGVAGEGQRQERQWFDEREGSSYGRWYYKSQNKILRI